MINENDYSEQRTPADNSTSSSLLPNTMLAAVKPTTQTANFYNSQRAKIKEAFESNPNISESELVELIYGIKKTEHSRHRGGYVSAIRRSVKLLELSINCC